MKKIGLASDHAGFELKQFVKIWLEARGLEYQDFGTYTPDSCDYADFAHPLALAVEAGDCYSGIAICGSGNGINMTLNHHQGIRAALCSDTFSTHATREHNDANILAMGARVVGEGLALDIVDTFLETEFSNDERHIRRINMIED